MAFERCASYFPPSATSSIAFVGDFPQDVDMDTGHVFSGPPGKVLTQMLRTANLERADYFQTNVFDVPAPTPVTAAQAAKNGWTTEREIAGRYFDPEFLGPQLERLMRELERVRPTIIVPMGMLALWAFTGSTAITNMRGAVMPATFVRPGAKILPTYHPSFVIKTWKMFHVTAADFIKAAVEAERGPEIVYTEREIWIEPNANDLRNFLRLHIAPAQLLTVDIETNPKFRQITCVGVGTDAGRAIVVPFVDWRKPNRSYWRSGEEEVAAWDWLDKVLRLPTPKLMQNGTYDAFWLWDRMGIPVMNYSEDTRLLHHALYPEMPKSLGFMGGCYAQVGAWKTMRSGSETAEKRDA